VLLCERSDERHVVCCAAGIRHFVLEADERYVSCASSRSCTSFPLYETAGSGHSPGGGPAHGDVTPGSAEEVGRVVHEVLCGGAGAMRASHVLAPVIPSDGSQCVDVSGAMVADLARGHFPA
jgi:hypothetical protein